MDNHDENEHENESKMDRRDFAKTLSLSALLPAGLAGGAATTATAAAPLTAKAATAVTTAQAAAGKAASANIMDLKDGIGYSDMGATDEEGNHQKGFSDRSSTPKADDPLAPYQMPLTDEEQEKVARSKEFE